MSTSRRLPAPSSVALALLALVPLAPPLAAQVAARSDAVDAVFADYAVDGVPGCAVGVSEGGTVTFERAWGLADLEHGVANTPTTRFESGSVSKQFTAAATILLALDGEISLDDDVRTYIPELPDYGETITIRHLLNHTSGLRDWGSVAGIEGWPRTTRVHSHTHMLDIASRQRELNYPPGTYYSYTNTGYNLQAVLIERVTGMPFAEFTRERLFEPLGMTGTEWRDDYRRVVEDRAQAYRPVGRGEFFLDMPFEHVHGNGGLITTVGDLLRWTHNLETGEVGGPRFLEEMHRQGVLRSGRTIPYASGLVHDDFRGVREVEHGGATAGYRAFLTRFPEQGVAVALLCNRADASPGGLAYQVAALWLEDALVDPGEPVAVEVDPARLTALEGTYRDTRTGNPVRVRVREGTLQVNGGDLVPLGEGRFAWAGGTVEVVPSDDGGRATLRRVDHDADTLWFEPVPDFEPSADELAAYAGTYRSDEAEAAYTVEVRDGRLHVLNRYGEARVVQPVYPEAFGGQGGLYWFERGEGGEVVALHLVSGRVWDLRFERHPPPGEE